MPWSRAAILEKTHAPRASETFPTARVFVAKFILHEDTIRCGLCCQSLTDCGRRAIKLTALVEDENILIVMSHHCGDEHDTQTLASTTEHTPVPGCRRRRIYLTVKSRLRIQRYKIHLPLLYLFLYLLALDARTWRIRAYVPWRHCFGRMTRPYCSNLRMSCSHTTILLWHRVSLNSEECLRDAVAVPMTLTVVSVTGDTINDA